MRWGMLLGALMLVPSLLTAQRKSWPVEVACEEGATPRYATAVVQVFLDIPMPAQGQPPHAGDSTTSLPRVPALLLRQRRAADALQQAFVLREKMVLPDDVVWFVPAPASASTETPSASPAQDTYAAPAEPSLVRADPFWPLSGNLTMQFDSTSGRLRDVLVDSTTFAEPMRLALRSAVEAAAQNGSLDGLGPEPLKLFVRAAASVPPETPLLHSRQVRYLTKEAATTLLTSLRPIYPKELLQAGTEGYADVVFTVLASGRATDVNVERTVHPAFGAAVTSALGAARFAPARAGGCAVSSSPVRQRVQFRLGD